MLKSIVAMVACPKCQHYFEAAGKRLVEVDLHRKANDPAFAIPAPNGEVALPPICCECGAPATRKIEVITHTPTHKFSIAMPHCARHNLGAPNGAETRQKSAGSPKSGPFDDTQTFFALKVKSYAFYCAYMHLNRATYF